jgi:hypothetical protein
MHCSVRLADWRAAVAGAAMLLLAACSDGGGAAVGVPSATVPTLPPQTTTTNPYDIPDVIDAAYVNRVLAGLDAAFGDIVRIVVRTRSVTPEILDRMKAIYADVTILNLQLRVLQDNLNLRPELLPAEPGNKVTTVSDLIIASPTCVFVRVSRDYSSHIGRQSPVRQEWAALVPMQPTAATPEVSLYNGVGWAWIYEGSTQSGEAPSKPPCDAR